MSRRLIPALSVYCLNKRRSPPRWSRINDCLRGSFGSRLHARRRLPLRAFRRCTARGGLERAGVALWLVLALRRLVGAPGAVRRIAGCAIAGLTLLRGGSSRQQHAKDNGDDLHRTFLRRSLNRHAPISVPATRHVVRCWREWISDRTGPRRQLRGPTDQLARVLSSAASSGGATTMRPLAMSMLGTNSAVNGTMTVVPPARGCSSRISPAPKS